MNKLFYFGVIGALFLLLGVTPLVAQEVVFTPGPAVTPTFGAANGGFSWADVNGDGTQDVFIPPNNILLNYLTYFTPRSATATAAIPAANNSVGGLLADINGDGVPDLWSTNNAAPQSGLFIDSAGVYIYPTGTGDLSKAGATGSVFAGLAVADIDHSNYLSAAWHGFKQATWSDNFVYKPGEGIEMLKGGPSGFTRVGNGAAPENLAIDTTRAFETWDVHFLDANNDGWADLLMPSFRHGFNRFDIQVDSIGARKGCILYLNDGTGKFIVPNATTVGRTLYNVDSVSAAGVIYSRAVADTGIIVDDTVRHFSAIGSNWGDLNNDGNVDLILTGLADTDNMNGAGGFQRIVVVYGKGDGTFTYKWNGTSYVNSGLPTVGQGIRAWDIGDYNNDGIPDVYGSTTFGTTRLWRGNGNGTYAEVTNQDNVATAGGGRAGGFIDYNNDGFLDIYNYTGNNSVLQKSSGNSNHWIGFTPVGTGHNLNAIGAVFTLFTQGSFKQVRYIKAEGNAAGQGEKRALFGIGLNSSIDRVEVRWPDGTTATYTGLAVDRYWTVKQGSTIPNTPTLASPANGATNVAVVDTLKWNAATGAVGYNVQVSLDPTFANKKMLAVDATVTGTSYGFSLGAATKYYWRVAAVNAGFKSEFTAANNFTTAGSAAVAVPKVISPANAGKVLENTIHNYNAAPVLRFILPAGKTLANYTSFTFKGYFAQGDVGYKHILVEAFQTMPTGQAFNNAANQIGDYNRALMGSTDWEDITIPTPNTMTLHDTIYVAFGINCAGTGDVGGTGVVTKWYADNVTLVDSPSVSQGFEGYSIGAAVPHIGWSQSDIQSVVVIDPKPSGAATNQPSNLTLVVNKTADASRYQWQVSTLPTFGTFFVYDSTADTTYAGQFTGGQTFYLRVRGMNDLGASAYSAVDTFTIMTPPVKTTLVSPANNTLNVPSDSVIFVWRLVANAASYNLQLSTVNSTTTYSGITDTTLKVKGLAKLTNYTWKVEAINAGGSSYFTGANAFTTIIAAPGNPTLKTPANTATGVSRNPKFVWGPVVNATKYRLMIATDKAFTVSSTVVDTVIYADTTCWLRTPLGSEADYYWQVYGGNDGGFSTSAPSPITFQTGTTAIEPIEQGLPATFALNQNYPNPFNPTTIIGYDIPKNAHVSIMIYDVLGRVVTTLVNEVKAANRYTVEWNASGVATGVYFYRMTAKSVDGSSDFNAVKKLLLVK